MGAHRFGAVRLGAVQKSTARGWRRDVDAGGEVRLAYGNFARNEKRARRPFLHDLQSHCELCRSLFGAGNETCTKTLSRCFPITFFAEVPSEDLNCSLVFGPRQQDRPKTSTHVHRLALNGPVPHPALRRPRQSRTGRLRLAPCPRTPSSRDDQADDLGASPALMPYRRQHSPRIASLMEWRRKNAHPRRGKSAHDSLSIYQDARAGMTSVDLPRLAGRWTATPIYLVLGETAGISRHTSTVLQESQLLTTLIA